MGGIRHALRSDVSPSCQSQASNLWPWPVRDAHDCHDGGCPGHVVVNVHSIVGPEASSVMDLCNTKVIMGTHRRAAMAGTSFAASTRDAVIRRVDWRCKAEGHFVVIASFGCLVLIRKRLNEPPVFSLLMRAAPLSSMLGHHNRACDSVCRGMPRRANEVSGSRKDASLSVATASLRGGAVMIDA